MSSKSPPVACWLDKSIGEDNTNLDLKKRAQSISNRIKQWKYFDCGDPFKEFLDANPNMKLIVIMSGMFAKQIVPLISDRDALHSVYVFCGNVEKYQSLLADEPKIKGIFDSDHQLFEQMRKDIEREFP